MNFGTSKDGTSKDETSKDQLGKVQKYLFCDIGCEEKLSYNKRVENDF
jgi:hypothetical protein